MAEREESYGGEGLDPGAPTAGTSRWAAWGIPALLIAAPFAYFWRGTLGQVLLAEGDSFSIFFPMRRLFGEQVAAGALPLWNPRVFSGIPFFAAMQTGMLYPLTWLFVALPPVAAMNLLIISQFGVTALCTYAYARTIRCTRLAAAYSGLAFAFGGFVVAHMGNLPMFEGVSWLPLLLTALERLRHRVQLRWVLVGIAALVLALFTGHPQMPAYEMMIAALYVAFFSVCDRPAAGRWRYVTSGALIIVGAVLLAAVQLVPGAELGAQSVRTQMTYDDFVAFALPALQLPMLLFPFFFGGQPGVPYWGRWFVLELTTYPGLISLALAGAAVLAVRRDRLVQFWLLIAAWTFLLALGGSLPPLARLMFHVPVYNLFRAPVRNLAVFALAIAVLAGRTLTHLPARRWARAVAVSAFAQLGLMLVIAACALAFGETIWGVLAATAFAGERLDALHATFSVRSLAIELPLGIAAATAGLALALAIRPRCWLIAALVGLSAVDLCAFRGLAPIVIPPPQFGTEPPPPVAYVLGATSPADPTRTVFAVAGGMTGINLIPAGLGVSMINGYDSMPLARYCEFAGGMPYWGVIPDSVLTGDARFLDLLNTRHLVVYLSQPSALGLWVDGVLMAREKLAVSLAPGQAVEYALPSAFATSALAAMTTMGWAESVAQDTPVLRVTLSAADGSQQELLWRAGTDTAEWAWDRPDLHGRVRHARARVVNGEQPFAPGGHMYFAVKDLPQSIATVRVRVESVAPTGGVEVFRLSLYDRASGASMPMSTFHTLLAQPGRWQQRFADPGSVVFENRRALPRAWLVAATRQLAAADVLQTVRTGRLPDGGDFDPAAVALVEDEASRELGSADGGAKVDIVSYAADRIALQSHSRAPAFLVLSEIFYPGWRAIVDGVAAPISRTDYVLRGVPLPAGDHRIEFRYDPWSVKVGALGSAATAAAFAVACLWRWRRRGARDSPPR